MVEIRINTDEIAKQLRWYQREQLPFATSLALNAVANDVAADVTASMDTELDRPTPFTKMAFMTKTGKFKGKRSSKRDLKVSIIADKVQAEYLLFQVEGGVRKPKKQAILVPTLKAPKDKYGNISRATRRRYAQPTGTLFHAGERENKEPGVYKRTRRSAAEMLAAYELQTEYKPRLKIYETAAKSVNANFNRRMIEALRRALNTMKA